MLRIIVILEFRSFSYTSGYTYFEILLKICSWVLNLKNLVLYFCIIQSQVMVLLPWGRWNRALVFPSKRGCIQKTIFSSISLTAYSQKQLLKNFCLTQKTSSEYFCRTEWLCFLNPFPEPPRESDPQRWEALESVQISRCVHCW